MTAKKVQVSDAAKIKFYEAALNFIAVWKDGDDFMRLDEPSSARAAREVLNYTGAKKTR